MRRWQRIGARAMVRRSRRKPHAFHGVGSGGHTRRARIGPSRSESIEPSTRGFSIRRRARFGANKTKKRNEFSTGRPNRPAPTEPIPNPALAGRPDPGGGPMRVNELGPSRPTGFRTASRTGSRFGNAPTSRATSTASAGTGLGAAIGQWPRPGPLPTFIQSRGKPIAAGSTRCRLRPDWEFTPHAIQQRIRLIRRPTVGAGRSFRLNLRPAYKSSSISALMRPDFTAALSAAWSRSVWSA